MMMMMMTMMMIINLFELANELSDGFHLLSLNSNLLASLLHLGGEDH